MTMSNEQVLEEMESLVEAVEQCFVMVVGIASETTDSGRVLRELLAAEQAQSLQFGPNGWRDRIARKMQLVAALKARRLSPGDPGLQSLAASVLAALDADVVH